MARAKAPGSTKKKDGFWETVKTIFWALLIAAAFRTILFQPFSIPSGSMKPTLLVGDYLFVSKFSYGYSRYSLPFSPDVGEGRIWGSVPERGDVVVFKHPGKDACSEGVIASTILFVSRLAGSRTAGADDCADYVKRVVGLPGERVQMKGGVLHINDTPVEMDLTDPFVEVYDPSRSIPRCQPPRPARGGDCIKEQWIETLPEGQSYSILNIDREIGVEGQNFSVDDTGVYTVPEGHVFFMGDNRDNSADSRADVRFVPLENLIGRADVIAFSWGGAIWEVWKWRADRFFKWIE
ncbi:MAG: signal peptidase I [Pseudomonadota bacterium]